MEGQKGCFSAPVGAYDKTIINRIMLRFRPIAPKPAIDVSSARDMPSEINRESTAKGRNKRKYVRVNRTKATTTRRRYKKNKMVEGRKDRGYGAAVVTLQLLPEIACHTETEKIDSGSNNKNLDLSGKAIEAPVQLLPKTIKPRDTDFGTLEIADQWSDLRVRMMPWTKAMIESVVTVEWVTDTYLDGRGLGSTDEEKMNNLEVDTCPGFVSDGIDRVCWVNLAYRRLVDPQGEEPPTVRLVMKEKLPVKLEAFACSVRINNNINNNSTWQKERQSQPQAIMPCDVWRMEFGGFAWRLDVQSALSLGR